MKLEISKEQCLRLAELEGDSEVGAGALARDPINPANCPHCEYDRRFPGFEGGGWMQQDNNGPIVSCPMCNPDGTFPPRP